MLQTLKEPPKKGSLRESALTLLLVRLENIEHAKFRAHAQIIIDKDAGVKAFEEYMTIAFPYMQKYKKRDKDEAIETLKKWAAKGPMGVKPLWEERRIKSRLRDKFDKDKAAAERLKRR